ncbi:hypothetical protein CSUI_004054 [Cystoisospora suis]|uniref:J domain-containing protein n=1 Tax=Cystoisospora suis TaxID=483139 RepID=A0A2C6L2P6_9APIC|nr:hypothetical protein CSUI_004054 [Cystoisospora suis]
MAPHMFSTSSSSSTLASLLTHFNLPPTCRNVKELRAAYFRLAMHLHPDKNDGEGCHQFTELQQRYLQCLHLLEKEEKHSTSYTFSRRPHSHSHHPRCSSSSLGREEEGGGEGGEGTSRSGGFSSSHHFHHHHHHHRGSAYERMFHMRGSPYPESFYTWKEGEGGGGKPGSYSFFHRFRSPFDSNHSTRSAPRFTSSHTHHAASWHHTCDTRRRQERTGGEGGGSAQSPFTSDHDGSILGLSKNTVVFLLGSGCFVTALGLMSSSSSPRTRWGKGKKEDEETFSLPHYLQQHSPVTPHRYRHRQGGEDELSMKESFSLHENGGDGQTPRTRRGRNAQKSGSPLETSSDLAEGIHGAHLSDQILKPLRETKGKSDGKKIGEKTRQDGEESGKGLHVVRLVPEANHERRGELLNIDDFATPERLVMSGESTLASERSFEEEGDRSNSQVGLLPLVKIVSEDDFLNRFQPSFSDVTPTTTASTKEGTALSSFLSPPVILSSSGESFAVDENGQEKQQKRPLEEPKPASKNQDRKNEVERRRKGAGPRGACDLLTTQYHRSTVRKKGQGKKRVETSSSQKKEAGEAKGQGPVHSARPSPSVFMPGPTPVDLTRGHRGVHRESRFISGYGGMTGVGFDDFLAASELGGTQDRGEARNTRATKTLEDSHKELKGLW